MSIPDQIDALNTDELLGAALPPTQPNFGPGIRGKFRAGTSFLAVLTLVLIGIQFIFTMYHPDLNDPDIWWHMRNAQYLFQHHQFPRTDMYSFTLAGHAWISHEWFAEIPYYISYRLFG